MSLPESAADFIAAMTDICNDDPEAAALFWSDSKDGPRRFTVWLPDVGFIECSKDSPGMPRKSWLDKIWGGEDCPSWSHMHGGTDGPGATRHY